MISVDIKGRIGEIRYKGDKSCIFIIETEEENELQCTITKQNIHLADLVKEGQEIGDKIGMNRSVIAGFARLSDSVVAKVMAKTKLHQKGRVTEDVANATHNFTEGIGMIKN